jgi:hypothetical protein
VFVLTYICVLLEKYFTNFLLHLHLLSSYLLGYMFFCMLFNNSNNVCFLYICLLGVNMGTVQLAYVKEHPVLLGYDTVSPGNQFLTF